MESTTYLLTIAFVCVIVGIYFFFVRARPDEKSGEPQ